jgi:Flp pilus assembly protein TadG
MRLLAPLFADRKGAGAIEFAIAAPLAIILLVGIAQLGTLFAANAGLQHAVDEGARYATLYPRPTDDAIKAVINQKKFKLGSDYITGPTLTHGTANGLPYVDISMSYAVPLNFVLFTTPPVTLSLTRRTYQF